MEYETPSIDVKYFTETDVITSSILQEGNDFSDVDDY